MEDKQKVLPEDYQFLWRVVSLQHALVVSAAAPVGIWKKEEGADFQMACLGMYYDCCEDERKAKATMTERIAVAEQDIKEHFRLHKDCLEQFLEMDGAIMVDDRTKFTDHCDKVCESVREYAELVKQHTQKLGNKSFLFYPYCMRGHYFYVLNYNRIRECSFNEGASYFGIEVGLEGIEDEILEFKISQDKLPYINPALDEALRTN